MFGFRLVHTVIYRLYILPRPLTCSMIVHTYIVNSDSLELCILPDSSRQDNIEPVLERTQFGRYGLPRFPAHDHRILFTWWNIGFITLCLPSWWNIGFITRCLLAGGISDLLHGVYLAGGISDLLHGVYLAGGISDLLHGVYLAGGISDLLSA